MASFTSDDDNRWASVPERLASEFTMPALNRPIVLTQGPVELRRGTELLSRIEGPLYLRWLPKPAIEFEGESPDFSIQHFEAEDLSVAAADLGLVAPAVLTAMTLASEGVHLRGVLRSGQWQSRDADAVNCIRFYLVRFPSYLGDLVRRPTEHGYALERGRLRLSSANITCTIDTIYESAQLSKQASREPGYLISHVGELRTGGVGLSQQEAREILEAVHWFFAFLRGARAGPVLPSNGAAFAEHWLEIASWKLDEPNRVTTWLPSHAPLDLNEFFSGYLGLWGDPLWRDALPTALAWYIAANSDRTPHEARIALTQIALETIAWVELVSKKCAYTPEGFEKLHAVGRLRVLLQAAGIPIVVPERMPTLYELATKEGWDGPTCLTFLRNKLEHPTPTNRQRIASAIGPLYLEAGQLGLEYFDLAMLALCGYRGRYAYRSLRGAEGGNEVLVPWATAT